MPDKPHYSPTQIDLEARCGEAYRRRYVDGEIIPPVIRMLKGTGLHGAAKANMVQKIDTHLDMPARDIVDLAIAEFEGAARGGYTIDPEDEGQSPSIALGAAKDELADMATAHAKHQAPEYQPLFVEQLVRIELPSMSHDLLGIVDLIDNQRRVIDWKTSRRSKSQSDADTSTQLTVYSVAHIALTGSPPTDLRLDTLISKSSGISRQVLSTTRGPDDYAALASRINLMDASIKAGIFKPAPPGSWWCSKAFCPFWSTCPYVNNK